MSSSSFIKAENEDLVYYKSRYSGFRVVFSKRNSISFKTSLSIEIRNEDEIAHAIEHLVTFSSRKQPESLLTIPHQFFGSYRARTAPNYNMYILKTLHEEGMMELLPLLLDTVFNPLFSESLYETEVHYIDEKGIDHGVIYNEVRSKLFFPELYLIEQLINQYRSIKGDHLNSGSDNFEFPSLNKIKKYHKEYYRLDNCILTLSGEIDHEKTLNLIDNFEKINKFVQSSTPIPDSSYQIGSFKNEIKFVDIPLETNYGLFYIIWKNDEITLMEYYESYLITIYSCGIIQKILDDKSMMIFCLISYACTLKPHYYRFKFSHIENDKLNDKFVNKFIREILDSLLEHEIQLNEIKKVVEEEFKDFDREIHDNIDPFLLYSKNNVDDVLNNFSKGKLKQRFLDKDKDYWQQLLVKYFQKKYTVMVFKPSKTLITKQEQEEIEKIKKRRRSMDKASMDKRKNKLEEIYRINYENADKAIDLAQNISMEFDELDELDRSKFIYHPDSNLNVTRIYQLDVLMDESKMEVELEFDLSNLQQGDYHLLLLYLELKEETMDKIEFKYSVDTISETSIKIRDDRLIYFFTISLDESWKIGHILDTYINSFDVNTVMIKRKLREIMFLDDFKAFRVNRLSSFINNYMLHDEDSIDKYIYSSITLYKIYEKLLESMNTVEKSEELMRRLIDLNETINNLNAHLRIEVNHLLPFLKTVLIKMPKLKNYSNTFSHNENQKKTPSALEKHLGRRYCVLTEECSVTMIRRFLPIRTVDDDENISTYLEILNEFFTYYVIVKYRRIHGYYYSGGVFMINKYSLIYGVNFCNNLIEVRKLHKELIYEIISKKTCVNLAEFEAAKRIVIRDSRNELKTYEDLKNVTIDTVIDTVGQYYIDLFDDTKTSEVIIIPKSQKESVEILENVEYKNFEDFMINSEDMDINKDLCTKLSLNLDDSKAH